MMIFSFSFLNRWGHLFLYSTLFFLFFVQIATTHDPDFGWHLLIGQEIVSTHAMPQPEHVLYPIQGVVWIDHEWFSNALLFLAYSSGPYGDMFLYIFFALCGTGTLILIEYIATRWFIDTTKQQHPSTFLILFFLQFFTATILLPFSGIRLQMLSWIFFLLLIFLVLFFLEKRKLRILWVIPFLLLLWANMHGSFFLGLLGYLASALTIALFLLTSPQEKIHLFLVGVFASLATLLTPYTTDLWQLLLVEYTQNNFYKTHLAEWLPVYLIPPFDTSSFKILPLALLVVFLASKKHFLSLWVFAQYPRLLYPFFLGWIALGIFYIEHRRHAPFFLFVTLFLLIPLAFKNFNLEKIPRIIALLSIFFTLIWSGIITLPKLSAIPEDPFSLAYAPATPKGVVDFLKANESELRPLHLFNYYSWGGYLEWMLPGWSFFIDGRFPQMPLPHKNISYIEEYYQFLEDKESLELIAEEYRIDLILLNTNWEIQEENLPFPWNHLLPKNTAQKSEQSDDWLYDYLLTHWEVLYSDNMSTLFRKKALQ